MLKKKVSYGVMIALLIFMLFLIWDSYSSKEKELPLGTLEKCGIEGCHGLDITCGSNIPEICDSSYAAGDNCRQYADCQIIDGTCQLIKNVNFNACKSCIMDCYNIADTIEFFKCESECFE